MTWEFSASHSLSHILNNPVKDLAAVFHEITCPLGVVADYIAAGPLPDEIILIDPGRAMVLRILGVDGPDLCADART